MKGLLRVRNNNVYVLDDRYLPCLNWGTPIVSDPGAPRLAPFYHHHVSIHQGSGSPTFSVPCSCAAPSEAGSCLFLDFVHSSVSLSSPCSFFFFQSAFSSSYLAVIPKLYHTVAHQVRQISAAAHLCSKWWTLVPFNMSL